jgi:phospholipid/cholesterol/gamma-HCH transport system substrate-binding protein
MVGRKAARWARRRALMLGTLLVAVFLVAVYIAITASSGLPGATGRTVKIAFADVGALRVGDDVRIASVRVGQVKDIQLAGGQPVVTLGFDGDRPIYHDASALTATVSSRSGLGQKYIEFQPGTPAAGELGANDVIPATKTGDAQELSDVLRVLDQPTRDALGSTLRQAGGGAAGHSQDFKDAAGALPQMLPDLGTISRALSAGNGADLTALLQAANGLAQSFQGHQQQLSELAGRLDTTLRAADVDGGKPLGDALDKAPQTLADTRAVLDQVRAPLEQTTQALTKLNPGAQALGEATGDLRGVLREGVPPLQKVPGVAGQADPAVTDLTQVMSDAQPLAPRLTQALHSAAQPLGVLALYAPEVSLFFSYATDALHSGDAAGNWLRFYPVLNLESVDGTVPIPDPTTKRDAYPAPGQAAKEKSTSLLGNRK